MIQVISPAGFENFFREVADLVAAGGRSGMCGPKHNAKSAPADITTDKVDELVDLPVAEVLDTRSIPLTITDDTIAQPVPLRRADGSSVYTVAGADLFTSTRILDAERRLVATAGRTEGRTVVITRRARQRINMTPCFAWRWRRPDHGSHGKVRLSFQP
jgi:hypothetical protein